MHDAHEADVLGPPQVDVEPRLARAHVVEHDGLQSGVGPLAAHQLDAGSPFPEALEGQVAPEDQDEAEHKCVDLVDVRVLKHILKVGRVSDLLVQFEQPRQQRRY